MAVLPYDDARERVRSAAGVAAARAEISAGRSLPGLRLAGSQDGADRTRRRDALRSPRAMYTAGRSNGFDEQAAGGDNGLSIRAKKVDTKYEFVTGELKPVGWQTRRAL
jgi:hypothetical protein